MLTSILNALLVIFAFGFVIFWHELGHFLAARWAKVRVEQFAVGMGQAIFSFRKGIGFRLGSSRAEYDRRTHEWLKASGQAPAQQGEWSEWQREQAANALGMGTTEYRLAWIPLGGYVKPTGQDDLRPASQVASDDPHSFGAAPVGKRMVIISAGVVMNVILAFVLYVILFWPMGFNAPPAVVGSVVAGSPAQAAGLQPGDRILTIDGEQQRDFTKIQMNVAMHKAGDQAEVVVDRPGQGKVTLHVTPAISGRSGGLLALGVGQPFSLKGVDPRGESVRTKSRAIDLLVGKDVRIVKVGDVDVSNDTDTHVLDQALQQAAGRPVRIVVRRDGQDVPFDVVGSVMSAETFAGQVQSIAGMLPRTQVAEVQIGAPADKAGLADGDVITRLSFAGSGDSILMPSIKEFTTSTLRAGSVGQKLLVERERDGVVLPAVEIDPSYVIRKSWLPGRSQKGIGVALRDDLGVPIVSQVQPDSVAANAGISKGDRIVKVAGQPVETWADVIAHLRTAGAKPVELTVKPASQEMTKAVTLHLDEPTATALVQMQFANVLVNSMLLQPLVEERQTSNPLEAVSWGIEETKYSIFQVYTTLRRLFEGSVPLSGLSGPLGIFNAGNAAATRGMDWLVWFTALISANLAVVNFLPIPIVDGGLFLFLLLEKITGRPPSPKVQTAAQIIGLVLLGSLFLFVTYHDILRTVG